MHAPPSPKARPGWGGGGLRVLYPYLSSFLCSRKPQIFFIKCTFIDQMHAYFLEIEVCNIYLPAIDLNNRSRDL